VLCCLVYSRSLRRSVIRNEASVFETFIVQLWDVFISQDAFSSNAVLRVLISKGAFVRKSARSIHTAGTLTWNVCECVMAHSIGRSLKLNTHPI
jgi:hypothetical protein